jgi:transglutaminase-like putative cysteine protease
MFGSERFGPREGWLTVALLGVMVWAVVHSIQEAGWVEHLDPLVPLAWLALLVGLAAAKSGLRPWVAHAAGAVVGVEMIVLVYANRMSPGDWADRLAELLGHVGAWVEAALGGGNSRDNLMFALVMAALAWGLGYASSWLVFRRGLGWAAVVLNGSALLFHLSSSYATLNYHFYILLFAGLLLVVCLELARREVFWRAGGLEVQGRVTRNVVLTSAIAVLLVMYAADRGPAERPVELFEPAWARVMDNWQRGQSHVDRLFGGVQGPPVVVVGLAFGSTMQPREGFELGTAPVLKIAAPRSRYWRTTTYDTYTGQGMVSGEVYGDRVEADQPIPIPFGAGEAREEMEQTITVLAPQSNLVFAADAPIRVSVPTLFEWRQTQDDPAALRLTTMIRRGQQYTVVSAASVATEPQLRAAGVEYPSGIERYLQLPPNLPQRVRQAAAEATAGAQTPYDQAVAIERLLRSLPYETRVPPPPADRDWVDYTLFEVQAGYSDYLSTAMVVMLRSVGVPARAVSGFAPGEYDEQEAAYVVFESEAHSWVEVFFPRYGWINFEPSSLRALPFRPTDENAIPIDAIAGEFGGELPDMFLDDPFFDGGEYFPSLAPRRDEAWIAALGFLGVLLALAGLAYWGLLVLFRRGLRDLPWHAQWYGQFRRLAAWGGLGGRPSQTPYEYAAWLEQRFPGSEEVVRPITDVYVQGTYSGQEPGPEALATASAAWDQVRGPLSRRVLLRGVIAARAQLRALRARLPRRD